jgi:micrococcal nuclease
MQHSGYTCGMYQYLATVDRVVDGDTFDVSVDVGFHVRMRMRLRLNGVDAYETRGPERPKGLEAKRFVQRRLPQGAAILIKTIKLGKYGRYVADVRYLYRHDEATLEKLIQQGTDLGTQLVRARLAKRVNY